MSAAETMLALVASSYGSWKNVHLGRSTRPQPKEHEVLIRTEASALNFPDLLMVEGKYQVRPPAPFIPGRDVAGRVVAVGSKVAEFAIGDRVAAQPPFGSFAEFVAAPDACCVAVPASVSFTDAAAFGTVLATVVGAMRIRARLRAGECLLMTGAGGGVGTAGIQYARHLGARVVALVSSDDKEAVARRLGAEIVLRSDKMSNLKSGMKDALLEAGVGSVDVVVDVVGGETFEGAIRCLVPGGRYVIVGFASGDIPQIAANYILLKDLVILGSSLDRLFKARDPELREGMRDAFEALASGKIKAEVEAVLPFSRFTDAASRIASRQAIGKIVFQGF